MTWSFAMHCGRQRAIRVLPWWAAIIAFAPLLMAQQGEPHAAYVYPAGGRQGTSFEVTVGGQYLNGASSALVSDSGVEATVLQYVKPLTPMEAQVLREQLKDLIARKNAAATKLPNGKQSQLPLPQPAWWTADDEKTVESIRIKLADFERRRANPAFGETVTLRITVVPNAQPGERELRLVTAAGLTNPLVFCVGQLPEFSKEWTLVNQDSLNLAMKGQRQPLSHAPPEPMAITPPATLNGQIMPGIADRYQFQGYKGQKLVIAARARELIPYIADAVPGWLEAALALYDADGKEVAYADHYLFHQDPVLYYTVPRDGQYVLEIKDALYRGREDFVYRAQVGELPFITSIFPLGGQAGTRPAVELTGWNLPATKLTPSASGTEKGTDTVSVHHGQWNSNLVPFAWDTLPECRAKEPNDQLQNAQRVKLPIIVNGRIERPGDWDTLRFEGHADEEIVAEVLARRLGSPLDPVLQLTDAHGRVVASNDDFADKGAGLLTNQADSRIDFKLPANGIYYLRLGDVQDKGGTEYAYRLRISRPMPDFELRVVPSSLNLRRGGSIPFTVYALRRDGFAGEIALRLKDAPPGFKLAGAVVPPGADQIRLTLTVPQGVPDQPRSIALEGSALIDGQEVDRPGVPADDMMQAFAYHHLVPAKVLLVAAPGHGRPPLQWKSSGDKPLKVPAGGTAEVQLHTPPWIGDHLQLTLDEPPDGISIENVSPTSGGVIVRLRAEASKVKTGTRGNLIFDAFRDPATNPVANKAPQRQPLGTLPALPFEIVSLAPSQR